MTRVLCSTVFVLVYLPWAWRPSVFNFDEFWSHCAMHCRYFDTARKGNQSSFLTPTGWWAMPPSVWNFRSRRKPTSITDMLFIYSSLYTIQDVLWCIVYCVLLCSLSVCLSVCLLFVCCLWVDVAWFK